MKAMLVGMWLMTASHIRYVIVHAVAFATRDEGHVVAHASSITLRLNLLLVLMSAFTWLVKAIEERCVELVIATLVDRTYQMIWLTILPVE